MEAIDIALAISLGIDLAGSEAPEPVAETVVKEVKVEDPNMKNALIKAEAERDIYKSLYEKLLKKAMRE